MPTLSLLYGGGLGLLYFGLSFWVVRFRQTRRVGLGDGGIAEMERVIRVHANFNEYVPMVLVLMGLLELSGLEKAWLHGLGGGLVLARVLHAWGLSGSEGVSVGRFIGTSLTFTCLVVASVLGLWSGLVGL